MKLNYKVLGLVMFVMLICCVSAASATDVDNITVPDDTGIIEIDDTVDSVDEVEQDRGMSGCDCNNCDCEIEVPTLPARSNPITITTQNDLNNKFTGGVFNDANVDEVIFVGNFGNGSYTTLNFNQSITINATGATFNNIGFGLLHNGIVLNGATIIINAPQNNDSYAIDIESASNTIVINNKINYTCGYDNAANYNYAIKAMNSENLTIYGNEINATVPLKQPDWYAVSTIASDFVAGVAVGSCDNFKFDKNNLTVIGNKRVGGFPTLDAFIIAQSANAKIRGNNIYESDIITATNQYSYIYGIDVYSCDNIKICSNTVDMNGNKSGGQVGGNGTGAAYCIQLTGPHTGVKICNNNLTTKNNGPNLGIYSQNYYGTTNITVCGNHIDVTGKAGSDEWSLVSGMELQDTYATVYCNTITVNNTAGYHANYCAYGISYCQNTYSDHCYYIYQNDVTVYNGDYTIYLIQSDNPDSYISNNCNLIAYTNTTSKTGDDTIYAPDLDYYG
ncbi:hypothetical protein [Methanobrevibacter sp.]|uniref:hypothetical protein n=1 Tax=Methanobrevibacter sp. TaxID=66852 RepID=UPI0038908497